MVTSYQAVIEAFKTLGHSRSISEIEDWLSNNFEERWKDIGTVMADMVSEKQGGKRA
ncbi:hypothetical protein [Brevibacillus centrosporus]|uniref:hypothetical protein n=1 Tax=Brevibacillus centrosporus TaxID=54910 RepID=UPI003B01104A